MKFDWRVVLFWIMLILSLILIIWNVFGDSPTEFFTLVAILVGIAVRMEMSSIKFARMETRFNYFERSFRGLAKDFKEHIKHK